MYSALTLAESANCSLVLLVDVYRLMEMGIKQYVAQNALMQTEGDMLAALRLVHETLEASLHNDILANISTQWQPRLQSQISTFQYLPRSIASSKVLMAF